MTEKAKEVGQHIRRLRAGLNFSQADMADQLGITAGAFAKIERGETDPSITRLYEIATILEVDIISLLQNQKTSNPTDNSGIQKQIDNLSKEVTELKKLVKRSPIKK